MKREDGRKPVKREDGRKPEELRPIEITVGYIKYPPGSVLIEIGDTKVACSASIVSGVPKWMKGKESGWITAEYGMLPASCTERIDRESSRGRQGGRTHEIQRLIGRSLRSVVDLEKLGDRTIWIDCDVIQADGGTRTASVTGGFIALLLALRNMVDEGLLDALPITDMVAAVSVGIVNNHILLDLSYSEDAQAEVDMNVVMTGKGEFIEIQGTGEKRPFSATEMQKMLTTAKKGILEIIKLQKRVLYKR